MKSFLAAISFLTILPLPPRWTQALPGLGRSAAWFSLVGAVVGALAAAVFYVTSLIFPAWLCALLAIGSLAWFSGGLHLDGLADCFDGMFHASNPQRRLEIMKDSRLGTFGALGLIFIILLKTGALSALTQPQAWLALPLAASGGRWLLLWGARMPSARPGGLGEAFSKDLQPTTLALAAIPPLILAIWIGPAGIFALALAGLAGGWVFLLARKQLGGVTGDVFGFVVELSETVILLVLAANIWGG